MSADPVAQTLDGVGPARAERAGRAGISAAAQSERAREVFVKTLVLFAIFAIHLAISLFLVRAGHTTIDEGIYDFMIRDFVQRQSFTVWNGYAEFPSPELQLPLMRLHNGTLAAQYPGLFAVLASPFYWLFGYRGLFLLNALAFTGAVALCFAIAQRLFRDTALALNACLILIFATFAYQYAQAAWPHAVSLFLTALALYHGIAAVQAAERSDRLRGAFLAGLAVGVGVGVRYDTVFMLPAVTLPFLLGRPMRLAPVAAVAAGLLPGLLAMTAINYVKFGHLTPFSYGTVGGASGSVTGYLPVVAAGLAATLLIWLAARAEVRAFVIAHREATVLVALAAAGALVFLPEVRGLIVRLADGAFQLLVDFRIRDLGLEEGGLSRGPTGGMVYLYALKKSLLQSAPYLAVIAMPFAVMLRGRDRVALGILFLVPAAFIGVYSYFAWHGGCCAKNLRYFVPALPALAILTAYAWRELRPSFTRYWKGLAVAGAIAAFAVQFFATYPEPVGIGAQEHIFLTVPLVLAGLLGGLLAAAGIAGGAASRRLRGAACATLLVGLVWAGLVAFTYDFARTYILRALRADFSETMNAVIEPDSIIFAQNGDQFFGLIERGDVRIAMPYLDDYATFRPLVDFYLDAGRAVYVWRGPAIEAALGERDLMGGLTVTWLYEDITGQLLRISRAPPSAPPAGASGRTGPAEGRQGPGSPEEMRAN